MTVKKIVVSFFILIFFSSFSFSNTEDFTEEVNFPIVSLPVIIPKMPEKKIDRKILQSTKKLLPQIKWEIDRQSGIQTISKIPNTEIFTGLGNKGTIFPSNNYRSMMLTVFAPSLILHSDFTLGFLKENTPLDFSIEKSPLTYGEWVSAETNIYVTKEYFLTDKVFLYPFAGYIFSEYYLQKFASEHTIPNFRIQALSLGSRITYKPARLISFDYALSFAPITMMDYTDLLFFQLNYKASFKLHTKFLHFSIILASKNNLTYSSNFLGKDSVQIFEAGFKFKVIL